MKKIFTLLAVALIGGSMSVDAQGTYILDINQIYTDAVAATGQCSNATQNSGTKYHLNETTYVQDIFTVVSKSNRTYRIDLVDPKDATKTYDYGDYTASARLEPNGASNSTGGRQMFVNVTNPGTLTIGAWSGTANRSCFVLPAENTTDYIDVEGQTPLVTFTGDEENDATYTIHLDAGLYCITQDAGIYYGYVKFTEDGGSSGITNIETEEADPNAPVYNLAGQRVDKNTKGILIQNGKKFVNK